MINRRLDRLTDKVGSEYGTVIVAAKRARQISNYYHHLGEGTFDVFTPPMVEIDSKNYITIALEEVIQDKLKFHSRAEESN